MHIPITRAVLLPFLLTRGCVLFVFLFVPLLASRPTETVREMSINKATSPIQELRRIQSVNDGVYYEAIATRGYDKESFNQDRMHNWGFFPLYPLLVSIFPTEFYVTGVIVSNLLFLAALFLLFRVAQESGLDDQQAARAVLYAAIFPASYFYSMALTESLFLVLSLLFTYLALKDRWWLAGIAAGFASATRVPGVLLLGMLLLLYWKRHGKAIKADILACFLAPVGLLVYMAYIWRITGNPLGAIQAQNSRDVSGASLLGPLVDAVIHPRLFVGWGFQPLSFGVALLVFYCVYKLAKAKQWAYAAYSLMSLLLPVSTGTLTSVPRYMAVVFPIYFVLAKLEQEQAISFAFTALLALLTVAAALRYTFALC